MARVQRRNQALCQLGAVIAVLLLIAWAGVAIAQDDSPDRSREQTMQQQRDQEAAGTQVREQEQRRIRDQIDGDSGRRLGRLDHLTGLQPERAPISWYANFPDHYAGDARPATAEKGERFLQYLVQRLVEVIRRVKEDRVAPELYQEFFGRIRH